MSKPLPMLTRLEVAIERIELAEQMADVLIALKPFGKQADEYDNMDLEVTLRPVPDDDEAEGDDWDHSDDDADESEEFEDSEESEFEDGLVYLLREDRPESEPYASWAFPEKNPVMFTVSDDKEPVRAVWLYDPLVSNAFVVCRGVDQVKGPIKSRLKKRILDALRSWHTVFEKTGGDLELAARPQIQVSRNDQMMARLLKDFETALGYSLRQWAVILNCSAPNVHKLQAWRLVMKFRKHNRQSFIDRSIFKGNWDDVNSELDSMDMADDE